MDTDIVLTRDQVRILIELVRDEAGRRLLAHQGVFWDTAEALQSALRISADEAPQFRLSYGGTVRPSSELDLREQVFKARSVVAGMIGRYATLAEQFAANLNTPQRRRDRDELLQHAQQVMQEAAQFLGTGQPPVGTFAVPPGALALYSVQVDQDRDAPHRLFLDYELARAAAGPNQDPEPQVVWAVAAPDTVSMWFGTVWIDQADGRETRSTLDRRWVQPEKEADSLVEPTVHVTQTSAMWSITGSGPDQLELTSAMSRQIQVLRSQIARRNADEIDRSII